MNTEKIMGYIEYLEKEVDRLHVVCETPSKTTKRHDCFEDLNNALRRFLQEPRSHGTLGDSPCDCLVCYGERVFSKANDCKFGDSDKESRKPVPTKDV